MSLHHNWTNIRSAGGAGKVVLGPAGSGEAGEKVAIEFGGCGFSGMERVAAAGREGVIELAVIIGAGVPATAYDDTPGRLTATCIEAAGDGWPPATLMRRTIFAGGIELVATMIVRTAG